MFCYHLSSASTKKCLIRHDTATSTHIQLVKQQQNFINNK